MRLNTNDEMKREVMGCAELIDRVVELQSDIISAKINFEREEERFERLDLGDYGKPSPSTIIWMKEKELKKTLKEAIEACMSNDVKRREK